MELKKFWKYLAIGMIVAVVFVITLNVGWETVFINLVLGFGTAIGKDIQTAVMIPAINIGIV